MMVLLVLNCIGASGFTAREPVIEAAEALINRMIPQMAARVHFRKISDDQEFEKTPKRNIRRFLYTLHPFV